MSEFLDRWQAKNEGITMSPEQVRQATNLSEIVLQDFPDDAVDWPGHGEHSSLVRHVSEDGRDALMASRFYQPAGHNRMAQKRYILELGTGMFTAVPDNEMIRSDRGRNRRSTNDGDWFEFIRLLESGKTFAETLRALEAKSGLQLGRAAVIDWDSLLGE